MNIFVLDLDPGRCARYHCDQHVGKMVLESVQIMCTVLNEKGYTTPYRSTHSHHPCVIWTGLSWANFEWLRDLAVELNREFCWRYERERDHASLAVLRQIEKLRYDDLGLTPFVQAMPERYKDPDDPVGAYRAFYIGEKARFATWRKGRQPDWFISADL